MATSENQNEQGNRSESLLVAPRVWIRGDGCSLVQNGDFSYTQECGSFKKDGPLFLYHKKI